jgi:hypothetical protein
MEAILLLLIVPAYGAFASRVNRIRLGIYREHKKLVANNETDRLAA